jgi:hypothetical protein
VSEPDKTIENFDDNSGKPLPLVLPDPTAWPITTALGVTLLAFGIVTAWPISVIGLGLFLVSAHGWFEDLRHDQWK